MRSQKRPWKPGQEDINLNSVAEEKPLTSKKSKAWQYTNISFDGGEMSPLVFTIRKNLVLSFCSFCLVQKHYCRIEC
jgi:hypothetical protein